MTTPTPELIVLKQEAELARTIDAILPWPPEVTWAFGHSPVVERRDTVVTAEVLTPADGAIALRMCKVDGQEYGIELTLPTTAEGILEAIQPGMTLAALGKLVASAR
jgi:hypothetical protein